MGAKRRVDGLDSRNMTVTMHSSPESEEVSSEDETNFQPMPRGTDEQISNKTAADSIPTDNYSTPVPWDWTNSDKNASREQSTGSVGTGLCQELGCDVRASDANEPLTQNPERHPSPPPPSPTSPIDNEHVKSFDARESASPAGAAKSTQTSMVHWLIPATVNLPESRGADATQPPSDGGRDGDAPGEGAGTASATSLARAEKDAPEQRHEGNSTTT